MFITLKQVIFVTSLAFFVISCSNQTPVAISDQSAEKTGRIGAWTYLASVPSPITSNPSMIGSTYYPGNYEMVRLSATNNSLEHLYWVPGLTSWVSTGTFANDEIGSNAALCVLLADNNLQVVVLDKNTSSLRHYWRNGSGAGAWVYTGLISSASSFRGTPAMICSPNYPANLEVVVQGGPTGLKHIWRSSDNVWHDDAAVIPAPPSGYRVDGNPKLTATADGNLHVIASIISDSIQTIHYLGYWKRIFSNNNYIWQYMGNNYQFMSTSIAFPTNYEIMSSNNNLEICYTVATSFSNACMVYRSYDQQMFYPDGLGGMIKDCQDISAVPVNSSNTFFLSIRKNGSREFGTITHYDL